MKAMVVDDSKDIRRLITRTLVSMGWEVVEAVDGVEALEKFQENGAFDLVTIDWNMPKMTGLELLKELKANPSLKDMHLIMITVEDEMNNVIDAARMGVDDYIVKPFQKEVLVHKIKKFGKATRTS